MIETITKDAFNNITVRCRDLQSRCEQLQTDLTAEQQKGLMLVQKVSQSRIRERSFANLAIGGIAGAVLGAVVVGYSSLSALNELHQSEIDQVYDKFGRQTGYLESQLGECNSRIRKSNLDEAEQSYRRSEGLKEENNAPPPLSPSNNGYE